MDDRAGGDPAACADRQPDVDKSALRRTTRRRREATDPVWRARAAEAVVRRLIKAAGPLPGATVMSYLAFGAELDLTAFHEAILSAGGRLVMPRVNGSVIEPVEFRADGAVAVSAFGIREPLGDPIDPGQIDLVVVPAVCFDRRGHRIGYGAGYYDRFLPLTRADARHVGVAFALQIIDRVPDESHDHRVPTIVTDEEVIVVGDSPGR